MSDDYPLKNISFEVQNFKCFGDEYAGVNDVKPINILIGRNNSGKSTIYDLLKLLCERGKYYEPSLHDHRGHKFSLKISQPLNEAALSFSFRKGMRGGDIPYLDHWEYGSQYIDSIVTTLEQNDWSRSFIKEPNFKGLKADAKERRISQVLSRLNNPFQDIRLIKINAERDVNPESENSPRMLEPSGRGVTGLIREFLTKDNLPRNQVEKELLAELNSIYKGDCHFTRILCQRNDTTQLWEIFLEEDKKGDIRLSQSGSSLKSIFLILATLRLYPLIEDIDWSKVIVILEEPENNLHPALLRRLLDFIATQRQQKRFGLFIATHSPICIDWSSSRNDSQIIHVQHNGRYATTKTATEFSQQREIINDLDFRASDILQANGIIWVEGPTDRMYLNKWIELFSKGELKEGTHYTIMFYGGRLLSHLDALSPDESDKMISLLSINSNIALVMDSDRHLGSKQSKGTPRMRLNDTKKRIKKEVENSNGMAWITEGREVENYIPNTVIERIIKTPLSKQIGKYDQVVEHSQLKDFKKDKINFASNVLQELELDELKHHLDLAKQMDNLIDHIQSWNGIPNS